MKKWVNHFLLKGNWWQWDKGLNIQQCIYLYEWRKDIYIWFLGPLIPHVTILKGKCETCRKRQGKIKLALPWRIYVILRAHASKRGFQARFSEGVDRPLQSSKPLVCCYKITLHQPIPPFLVFHLSQVFSFSSFLFHFQYKILTLVIKGSGRNGTHPRFTCPPYLYSLPLVTSSNLSSLTTWGWNWFPEYQTKDPLRKKNQVWVVCDLDPSLNQVCTREYRDPWVHNMDPNTRMSAMCILKDLFGFERKI